MRVFYVGVAGVAGYPKTYALTQKVSEHRVKEEYHDEYTQQLAQPATPATA